jgi:hypothetical protein
LLRPKARSNGSMSGTRRSRLSRRVPRRI